MEAPAPADGSLQAGADPMRPRPYRVVRNRRETRGVMTLTLEPLEAPESQERQPASYEPGQFNMLWAFGVGEAAISISGGRPGGAVLHTIRDVGAISGALCRARRGP